MSAIRSQNIKLVIMSSEVAECSGLWGNQRREKPLASNGRQAAGVLRIAGENREQPNGLPEVALRTAFPGALAFDHPHPRPVDEARRATPVQHVSGHLHVRALLHEPFTLSRHDDPPRSSSK